MLNVTKCEGLIVLDDDRDYLISFPPFEAQRIAADIMALCPAPDPGLVLAARVKAVSELLGCKIGMAYRIVRASDYDEVQKILALQESTEDARS